MDVCRIPRCRRITTDHRIPLPIFFHLLQSQEPTYQQILIMMGEILLYHHQHRRRNHFNSTYTMFTSSCNSCAPYSIINVTPQMQSGIARQSESGNNFHLFYRRRAFINSPTQEPFGWTLFILSKPELSLPSSSSQHQNNHIDGCPQH